MYQPRRNKVSVKKIAEFLKTSYTGRDFEITSLSSLNNIKKNSILFYSDIINSKFKYSPDVHDLIVDDNSPEQTTEKNKELKLSLIHISRSRP